VSWCQVIMNLAQCFICFPKTCLACSRQCCPANYMIPYLWLPFFHILHKIFHTFQREWDKTTHRGLQRWCDQQWFHFYITSSTWSWLIRELSLSAVHVTLLTPGVVAYFLIYKCVINVSLFFQLFQYTNWMQKKEWDRGFGSGLPPKQSHISPWG